MKTIQIMGGTMIDKACMDAAADARLEGEPVEFEFNGTKIVAQPTGSADEMEAHAKALAAKWRADTATAAAAYRASPEHRRREELRAAELAADQDRHARLMQRLPSLEGHKAWLTWAKDYVGVVDVAGVRHDFATAEAAMRRAGYRRNDELAPEDLEGAERVAWVRALEADADRLARYIMGQIMDGFHGPGPGPHPSARFFVEEWLKRHGGPA